MISDFWLLLAGTAANNGKVNQRAADRTRGLPLAAEKISVFDTTGFFLLPGRFLFFFSRCRRPYYLSEASVSFYIFKICFNFILIFLFTTIFLPFLLFLHTFCWIHFTSSHAYVCTDHIYIYIYIDRDKKKYRD